MSELSGQYVDVGEAKSEAPAWVIENLLIRGLTLIGAPPKAGKSTWTMILAALCAEWSCKALPPFMSKAKRPGPTICFSAEASAGELKFILEEGLNVKTKADGSILIIDDESDFQLDSPSGMKSLLADLKDLDPRLVILDPLRDFHSMTENDSNGVIELIKPLRKWAKKNDAAFVICHHTTKPPALEREKWKFKPSDLRGSTALFGKADGVLMLTPVVEGVPTKVHVQAIFKRARGWESDIHLAAWDEDIERGRELFTDVDNQVLKGLKSGMVPEMVGAALHLSNDLLKATLEKLQRNGAIKLS